MSSNIKNITHLAADILISNGYDLETDIIANANPHRIGKSGSQWYICYSHYILADDFSGLLPPIHQFINTGEPLTLEQRKELHVQIEKRKQEIAEKRIERNKKASEEATRTWNSALDGGHSIYLTNKGLHNFGEIDGVKFGKKDRSWHIITPIQDNEGTIHSLQYIYDGRNNTSLKCFLKDGKIKGNYGEFGNIQSNVIFICEGVATALSILQAQEGSLVIVAYSCHNLKDVTKNITIKYPGRNIVIAGDNDSSKEQNIGKEKAEKVAEEFSLPVALPRFNADSMELSVKKPSDFDDLRYLEGKSVVRCQLNVAVNSNKTISIKATNLRPVKKFDIHGCLPEVLHDFVSNASHRMHVPPEFIAAPLLVGLSSLIATKIVIKPKKHDDFLVFPNLWGGIVSYPSSKKTAALKEALFFFSALEKAAAKEFHDKEEQYKKDFTKYDLTKKALKEELFKHVKRGASIEEIEEKLDLLEEPKKPALERYRTNIATSQKITEILSANQHPSLLLERDELSGFLSDLNKKENEADRGYYLEMWNGNSTMRNDTITRGTVVANNAAISIIGTTQVDLINAYLNKAANEHNDGLLQRFQLIIFPDPMKDVYTDSKPDQHARDKVSAVANFFNRGDFSDYASDFIECDGKVYACLSFNEESQKIFRKWYDEGSEKIGRYSETSASMLAQHLSKYRKLLPALCGIFHLMQENKNERLISVDTITSAIKMCDFLESHAVRIYGLLDPEGMYNASALELIGKIKHKFISEGERFVLSKAFTRRDLSRKFNSYRNETLGKIIDVLVEHKYLLERHTPSGYQQKEKYSYTVNPHLIQDWKAERG